jgi:hypothetical protein
MSLLHPCHKPLPTLTESNLIPTESSFWQAGGDPRLGRQVPTESNFLVRAGSGRPGYPPVGDGMGTRSPASGITSTRPRPPISRAASATAQASDGAWRA